MANYYTQFSEVIPDLTAEEETWLRSNWRATKVAALAWNTITSSSTTTARAC